MPDARCTRSRLCSKKHRRQQLQVHRNSRHSLRNGFNGVLRALLGDHCLVATVISGSFRSFSACIGAPGPHDFAVRNHTTSPSAKTLLVRAMLRFNALRPSHPIPNVRDDREAPLYGERDKRNETTDLGVRSIAADRDTMARRANYADEPCTFASHRSSFRGDAQAYRGATIPSCLSSSTNAIPPFSKAAFIAARLFLVGSRRPASKSLTVETPTLAAFASLSWGQFSDARAARHCSGVILRIYGPKLFSSKSYIFVDTVNFITCR